MSSLILLYFFLRANIQKSVCQKCCEHTNIYAQNTITAKHKVDFVKTCKLLITVLYFLVYISYYGTPESTRVCLKKTKDIIVF
jgi:hypothetical protein